MDTLGQIGRHVQFEEDDARKSNVLSSASPLGSVQGEDEHRTGSVQTKKKGKYTVWGGLRATLFASWITIILIPAVPAGFAVKYTDQSPVATFAVNFVAIIPLGQILDAVTEELVIRRGGHEGMLIVITFGYVQSTTTVLARMPKRHFKQCGPVGNYHHRSGQTSNSDRANLSHWRSHFQQRAHGGHRILLRRHQSSRAKFQSNHRRQLFERTRTQRRSPHIAYRHEHFQQARHRQATHGEVLARRGHTLANLIHLFLPLLLQDAFNHVQRTTSESRATESQSPARRCRERGRTAWRELGSVRGRCYWRERDCETFSGDSSAKDVAASSGVHTHHCHSLPGIQYHLCRGQY